MILQLKFEQILASFKSNSYVYPRPDFLSGELKHVKDTNDHVNFHFCVQNFDLQILMSEMTLTKVVLSMEKNNIDTICNWGLLYCTAMICRRTIFY